MEMFAKFTNAIKSQMMEPSSSSSGQSLSSIRPGSVVVASTEQMKGNMLKSVSAENYAAMYLSLQLVTGDEITPYQLVCNGQVIKIVSTMTVSPDLQQQQVASINSEKPNNDSEVTILTLRNSADNSIISIQFNKLNKSSSGNNDNNQKKLPTMSSKQPTCNNFRRWQTCLCEAVANTIFINAYRTKYDGSMSLRAVEAAINQCEHVYVSSEHAVIQRAKRIWNLKVEIHQVLATLSTDPMKYSQEQLYELICRAEREQVLFWDDELIMVKRVAPRALSAFQLHSICKQRIRSIATPKQYKSSAPKITTQAQPTNNDNSNENTKRTSSGDNIKKRNKSSESAAAPTDFKEGQQALRKSKSPGRTKRVRIASEKDKTVYEMTYDEPVTSTIIVGPLDSGDNSTPVSVSADDDAVAVDTENSPRAINLDAKDGTFVSIDLSSPSPQKSAVPTVAPPTVAAVELPAVFKVPTIYSPSRKPLSLPPLSPLSPLSPTSPMQRQQPLKPATTAAKVASPPKSAAKSPPAPVFASPRGDFSGFQAIGVNDENRANTSNVVTDLSVAPTVTPKRIQSSTVDTNMPMTFAKANVHVDTAALNARNSPEFELVQTSTTSPDGEEIQTSKWQAKRRITYQAAIEEMVRKSKVQQNTTNDSDVDLETSGSVGTSTSSSDECIDEMTNDPASLATTFSAEIQRLVTASPFRCQQNPLRAVKYDLVANSLPMEPILTPVPTTPSSRTSSSTPSTFSVVLASLNTDDCDGASSDHCGACDTDDYSDDLVIVEDVDDCLEETLDLQHTGHNQDVTSVRNDSIQIFMQTVESAYAYIQPSNLSSQAFLRLVVLFCCLAIVIITSVPNMSSVSLEPFDLRETSVDVSVLSAATVVQQASNQSEEQLPIRNSFVTELLQPQSIADIGTEIGNDTKALIDHNIIFELQGEQVAVVLKDIPSARDAESATHAAVTQLSLDDPDVSDVRPDQIRRTPVSRNRRGFRPSKPAAFDTARNEDPYPKKKTPIIGLLHRVSTVPAVIDDMKKGSGKVSLSLVEDTAMNALVPRKSGVVISNIVRSLLLVPKTWDVQTASLKAMRIMSYAVVRANNMRTHLAVTARSLVESASVGVRDIYDVSKMSAHYHIMKTLTTFCGNGSSACKPMTFASRVVQELKEAVEVAPSVAVASTKTARIHIMNWLTVATSTLKNVGQQTIVEVKRLHALQEQLDNQ
jgi:hypothetical protein